MRSWRRQVMTSMRHGDQRDEIRWRMRHTLKHVHLRVSRSIQAVPAISNEQGASHSNAQTLGQAARAVECPQTLRLRGDGGDAPRRVG